MLKQLLVFALCLTVAHAASFSTLKQGSWDANVASLQYLLRYRGYSLTIDGSFGSGTKSQVQSYQQANGLSADGVVGSATWTKLVKYVYKGSDNAAVQALQYCLRHKFNYDVDIDGNFGQMTKMMVRSWQASVGLTDDGKVGTTSWKNLLGTKSSSCSSGASYVCDGDWRVRCNGNEAHWRSLCLNGCNNGQCVVKSYYSGSLTSTQLRQIMPSLSSTSAANYVSDLSTAMQSGSINYSGLRIAAFLAQVGHESGELQYWTEIGSYCNNYEGRVDLGNVYPGDGCKYKGRGPLQLTGRSNYDAAGKALGMDLVNNPTRVADKDVGFKTSVWFWNRKSLSFKADSRDFDYITYRINGGFNGKADRDTKYERAKDVLTTSTGSASYNLGTLEGPAFDYPVANATLPQNPVSVVDPWWTPLIASLLGTHLHTYPILIYIAVAAIAAITMGVIYRRERTQGRRKTAMIRFLKTKTGLPDNFNFEVASAQFSQESDNSQPLTTPLINGMEQEPVNV